MKKIIFLVLNLILISSCAKQELILNEKVFAVIPHHNLVNDSIDDFYSQLKEKHWNFDNIILISPNHFIGQNFVINKPWKYCYNESCIDFSAINSQNNKETINTIQAKEWYFNVREHGIWNHFSFINKYFKWTNNYAVLLKINTKKDDYFKKINQKISDLELKWKTLYIASVDFSHHVNEKVAVFHDLNSIDYLNNWKEQDIEVDCPNCLFLLKDLATVSNQNHFNVYNRTSVDEKLNINSNYNNTTHVYGEFSNKKVDNLNEIFANNLTYSTFQNSTNQDSWSDVFWMFFWDTHFTRWFDKLNNDAIVDNLVCFYSNTKKHRPPKFRHNRMFYGFDFAGVNLETVIWDKESLKKNNKPINFLTKSKYLKNFKSVWINLFNLANNHTYDYWKEWFNITKENLDKENLNYFGEEKDWINNILKKEVNGTKVAFVWYNDIGTQFDIDEKTKEIKQLNNEWYVVIVNIHWWYEYESKSNSRQQKIAKSFIDAWAKLIVWHHPHVVQEIETYKWIPIFYSLWNFIFDQTFWETNKGYGLVYAINSKWIKYNILEFQKDKSTSKINCSTFK